MHPCRGEAGPTAAAIRKFEHAYGRWQERRLSQTEAAEITGHEFANVPALARALRHRRGSRVCSINGSARARPDGSRWTNHVVTSITLRIIQSFLIPAYVA
jgi:hypothetical protein